MAIERIDTVVVGGGQAGLAMSEHLTRCGVPHLVLERHRIAERWRSERWDSLVANGPAWHDRFPGMEFPDLDPDAFAPKEKVADYFVAYAKQIAAPDPLRRRGDAGAKKCRPTRIPSRNVRRRDRSQQRRRRHRTFSAPGHPAHCSRGRRRPCRSIPAPTAIPTSCPTGAVLVVGAGSSGVQIADELLHAGRRVYLSVGPHDRPPRAYRGRDFCWWLGVLGKWDAEAPGPGTEHVTIAVSGARGGQTVDFRRLAAQGMTLVGRTSSYRDGTMTFARDLADNIARGDANYLSLLDEADAYFARNGLDLPEEPEARKIEPDPECVTNPILELDLARGRSNLDHLGDRFCC